MSARILKADILNTITSYVRIKYTWKGIIEIGYDVSCTRYLLRTFIDKYGLTINELSYINREDISQDYVYDRLLDYYKKLDFAFTSYSNKLWC